MIGVWCDRCDCNQNTGEDALKLTEIQLFAHSTTSTMGEPSFK